jgi:hypothetical protein
VSESAAGFGGAFLRAPADVVDALRALRETGAFSPPAEPLPPGQHTGPIRLDPATVRQLVAGAAGRVVGQTDPNTVTEVVWSEGGDELAVDLAKMDVHVGTGVVVFAVPVRCDESGQGIAQIPIAVGTPDRAAGMFAAAGRPIGPPAVVGRWSDALTALTWATLLELANAVAAGAGVDTGGAPLVAGSIAAGDGVLFLVPFARYPLGPLLT